MLPCYHHLAGGIATDFDKINSSGNVVVGYLSAFHVEYMQYQSVGSLNFDLSVFRPNAYVVDLCVINAVAVFGDTAEVHPVVAQLVSVCGSAGHDDVGVTGYIPKCTFVTDGRIFGMAADCCKMGAAMKCVS